MKTMSTMPNSNPGDSDPKGGRERLWRGTMAPGRGAQTTLRHAALSESRTMKCSVFFKRAERQRDETAVFVSLGLAGLIAVAVAASSMSDFVRGSDRIAAALSPPPPPVALNAQGRERAPLHQWQWQADARTVVAAIRYVLDPSV